MERLPEELNNQLFQKLKSIVEIERMSANERLEYELSLAVERDLLSALEASREDGREEGKLEGLKIGVKEGEKLAVRRIALSMKQSGTSLPEIIKLTGLPLQEIEQL